MTKVEAEAEAIAQNAAGDAPAGTIAVAMPDPSLGAVKDDWVVIVVVNR